MSESIDLPLNDDDRLYEPPLVDSIRFDASARAFAIRFVPNDAASKEPTELVVINEASVDYARLQTFWARLHTLAGYSGELARIVHGGGSDYTFHFADTVALGISMLPNGHTAEAIDRLKQIADIAEISFLELRYRLTA